jgi:hypothetical protein
MKKVLQLSNILTWFNMIVASFIVMILVFSLITPGSPTLAVITMAVFIASVILHSYAAIQLRKSILQPQHALERNTPVGIKFIGYLVLLIGFLMIVNCISALQNSREILSSFKMPPEAKNFNIEKIFKGFAIFIGIFGITMVLNVLMNLRLLRAYQMIMGDGNK